MNSSEIYKAIYEASIKFMVPLDVQETYMAISKEAIDLVDGSYASIFLFQNGKLKKVYTSFDKLKGIIPRKEGSTYEAFQTGVAQLRHKKELLDANSKFKELPVESNISLPLVYGHITIGVLSVLSKKHKKFNRDDLYKLMLFAPLATMVIRKNQFIEEAENAVASRDLFISMAEHELKNPLTLLSLNTQLLLKSNKLRDLPEYDRIVSLQETSQRLIGLVEELLASGGSKEGKLIFNFGKHNIVKILKQTTEELSFQHPYRKLLFVNSSNKKFVYANVDEDKIKQVVINLINNALKFSKEDKPVSINLHLEKGHVLVDVADQGIGISDLDVPKVFKQYYKGNTKEKGLGIGLYLVKEVITEHGGKVTIRSKLGKGTTVSFSLPMIKEKNARKG